MPRLRTSLDPTAPRRVASETSVQQGAVTESRDPPQPGGSEIAPGGYEVGRTRREELPASGVGTSSLKAPGLVTLGSVPVPALQQATRQRAANVRAFATLAAEAKQRGLDVYVLGGGATAFAAHVKAGLLSAGGDPNLRADWVMSDELSAFLNLATQDLDLVIARHDGKPETLQDIADFQRFVDEHLGSVEIDVRGMSTPKDEVHFPLTRGSPYFQEHHNNLDSLMLCLTAGPNDPPLLDLAALAGGAGKAVDDLAAGTLRLKLSPDHDKTPTGRTGNSPPVKHAFRALIKAVRHGLVPDAETRGTLRKIFASWTPHVDNNDVVGRWMKTNLKKLVVDAMDLPSAFKLLDDVGALAQLRAIDDPELHALFARQPLVVEAPDEKPSGKTARDLGIDKLWHLTGDYEAFVAMTRTPLWRPNFLSSTGMNDGTAARYGAGVYFTQAGQAWGEQNGQAKGGYLVEVKLDPNAREGTDFRRVVSESGQTFIVVKKRNMLTLDQQPLHKLDLGNALKMLFAPETGSRLHVLEQLQERLLALATDPSARTELQARLLEQAKQCPEQQLSGFVPILADRRLRALVPDVLDTLLHRTLARGDVVTALELLQTPTDGAIVRRFAKEVLPLVDANAGYFINTFPRQLFPMFEQCPDALLPILEACQSPRSFVVAGLEHGDARFVPMLVTLAKAMDDSDRNMIRSWNASDLDRPGFEPLARALGR